MQNHEHDVCPGMGRKKLSELDKALDKLLAEHGGSAGVGGKDGLLAQLTGRLVERALNGELDHHLGYGPDEQVPEEQANRRQWQKQTAYPHGLWTRRYRSAA